MARRASRHPPDQAERDRAVAERARNVLIDAGAGTGKTTILIDRLVRMVAPPDGAPPVPIGRLAAITFTRKAAGELRLRIRERLLRELAEPGVPAERAQRLRDALAGLDTAYVGTIHSFADRLLRLRPVEAELSPSYEIAEDEEVLVRETFEVLLHAVEKGTLAAELAGTAAAARAEEATRIIVLALGAGIRAESQEFEFYTRWGLDGLVAQFLGQRDVRPRDTEPARFDLAAFRAAVDELAGLARRIRGHSRGAQWITQAAARLGAVRHWEDPALIFQEVRRLLDRVPDNVTRRDTFQGDAIAWQVWKKFWDGDRERPTPLGDDLRAPLERWLATRLARLFPVVTALYEKVKARHRALDQLDLLVKLRDLLARDREVRREFQGMFDHIFVDEFQDTDPLQAEIVLFLCEREPLAARWDEVVLRDSALTLVGDPKQSIYRFRRADIAMYDRVRQVVARGAHLPVTLSANFRSVPPLIDWLNDRFDRILGPSPDGRPFDRETGRVFQHPLLAGRQDVSGSAVHVLPFDFADATKHLVDDYRALESRVLARYLRWLVEASAVRIADPLDRRPRRPGYGDIAVLAISTWSLPVLFAGLDAEGVPYASRGGTLFLSDPLHRQFLLGLRAVADRDDGVAEAALLRPPFFALDLTDLVLAQDAEDDSTGEAVRRVREARDLVRELRRRRFERPPGATARDLLDRTAFARATALGPNGAQRLARLRELCHVLEHAAAAEGLDYDAVTARLRAWVAEPIQLDPPYPVGTEAIQALTVHQAKGLEFPVVVLWDGRGEWKTRTDPGAWHVERDGRGWLMRLQGLTWEEPAGLALRETERAYLDAERRRVVYVAATRARDLFVVPRAGDVLRDARLICRDLLDAAPEALVRELEPYRDGTGASWARAVGDRATTSRGDATALEREVAERWARVATEAVRPRFRPVAVSGEARAALAEEATDAVEPATRKPREGRFGSLFGTTVHLAIGLALRDPRPTESEAVHLAASRVGLTDHLDDAVADVARALEALRAEGLARPVGADLQLEYPIAGAWEEGLLLSGYIDLVAATGDRLDLLDFKTDAPPAGDAPQAYPEYARQVRLYGQLLDAAGLTQGRQLRCGLLFTADGAIRWVEDEYRS